MTCIQDFSHMTELSSLLDSHHLKIALVLGVGFVLASILGYLAVRLKVSSIIGYLIAGYLIGPYSPGLVADRFLAEQLAEVGVILMMFGVGLNFRLHDLVKVGKIAIPGAIGQTFFSALFCSGILFFLGFSWMMGMILGLAIGVASTIVLFRMLGEYQLFHTKEGVIAAGWLILEDIITVIVLLLLPTFVELSQGGTFSWEETGKCVGFVILKFAFLAFLLLTCCRKVVSFLLSKVLATKSHELFTLAILALIFLIAIASSLFFGISIALGAFLAGMVVRQAKKHNVAFEHSLPIKDAFIAIFFLSIGMLFNPFAIVNYWELFAVVLGIILIAKPLIAFLITKSFGYSSMVALTIAAALAQIGEFSFILVEEAKKIRGDAHRRV